MLFVALVLGVWVVVLAALYAREKRRHHDGDVPPFYKSFAQTLPFGVLIWDVDLDDWRASCLVHVNKVAQQAADLEGLQLRTGARYGRVADVAPEIVETARVSHLKALRQRTAHVRHTTLNRRAWRIHTVPLGTDNYVADIYVDITDIQDTVELLRRTNADLEQFAYSASHDLQEPLRMIGGWVTALFEDYGDRLQEPEAEEAREFIVGGVARMRTLIDDLLRFSRAGRNLRRSHFSLMSALNEVISNLALSIKETRALVRADDLPMVYGDPSMVTQVLQNLMSNSLKFRRPGALPIIVVTAEVEPHAVLVTVKDNGLGVEPQYQDTVFEVFSRLYTRDDYDGTGIGLALARRIIHAHGGIIELESAGTNQGTTVSFTLPFEGSGGTAGKTDA